MEIVANVSQNAAVVREEFAMDAHCPDRAEVGGSPDVSARFEQYAGVLYRSPSRHSMGDGALLGHQRAIRSESLRRCGPGGCDRRDGLPGVQRAALERAIALGGLARCPALPADDLSLEPHRAGRAARGG